MELRNSKTALIMMLFLFLSSLPLVFFRELHLTNEMDYFAVALDAVSRSNFLTFYENSVPYTERPPLYLWLCMLSASILGVKSAVIFLLFVNVVLFAFTMLELDRTFGPMLQTSFRGRAAIAITSIPYLVCNVYMIQPEIISIFCVILCVCALMHRTEMFWEDSDNASGKWGISICITLTAGFFASGAYALLIPPATLFLALLIKRRLKLYFKILSPVYLLIVFLVISVWLFLVFAESNWAYLVKLLFEPYARFTGQLGHNHSFLFFLWSFWYISLPLGFCAFYAIIRLLYLKRSNIDLKPLFAIALPVACLIIISIPAAKHESYALYALPTLGYLTIYYVQQEGSRDRFIKILMIAGLVPFIFLFISYFFFREYYSFLDSNYEICALLFITLSTVLAIIKVINSSAVNGLCGFSIGVLVMVFTVGFSMPTVNPYISPIPVMEHIVADSKQSKINSVCMVGQSRVWKLKVLYSSLNIRNVDSDLLESDTCKNSYRIIGKNALKYDESLSRLKKQSNALMLGDTLVVDVFAKQ